MMARGVGRWLAPLLLFLLAFVPALWIWHGLYSRLPLPDAGYRLEIPKGGSLGQVAATLEQEQVIPSALLARVWWRLHPGDHPLHAGVWLLRPPQTTASVLQMLLAGSRQSASRLTVVEGIGYRDLLDLLAARGDVRMTPKLDAAALLAAIDATENHPEGLFAPDTYDVGAGDTDIRILRHLYERQQ